MSQLRKQLRVATSNAECVGARVLAFEMKIVDRAACVVKAMVMLCIHVLAERAVVVIEEELRLANGEGALDERLEYSENGASA